MNSDNVCPSLSFTLTRVPLSVSASSPPSIIIHSSVSSFVLVVSLEGINRQPVVIGVIAVFFNLVFQFPEDSDPPYRVCILRVLRIHDPVKPAVFKADRVGKLAADREHRFIHAAAPGIYIEVAVSPVIREGEAPVRFDVAVPPVPDQIPGCTLSQFIVDTLNLQVQQFLFLFRQGIRALRQQGQRVHAVFSHRQAVVFVGFDAAHVLALRAVEAVAHRAAGDFPRIGFPDDHAAVQQGQRLFPVLLRHFHVDEAFLAVRHPFPDHRCRGIHLFQAEELPHADRFKSVGCQSFLRVSAGRVQGLQSPHDLIQGLRVGILILIYGASAHAQQHRLGFSFRAVLHGVDGVFTGIGAGRYRVPVPGPGFFRHLCQIPEPVTDRRQTAGSSAVQVICQLHAPPLEQHLQDLFLAVRRLQIRLLRAPEVPGRVDAAQADLSVIRVRFQRTVQNDPRPVLGPGRGFRIGFGIGIWSGTRSRAASVNDELGHAYLDIAGVGIAQYEGGGVDGEYAILSVYRICQGQLR